MIFGSIIPAYPTNRSLLFSYFPGVTAVASLDDVKSAVSKLAIFDDTTFKRRFTLNTNADWSEFTESCQDGGDTSASNLELL